MMFQVVALVLWVWEKYTRKSTAELFGLDSKESRPPIRRVTLSAITAGHRESVQEAAARDQGADVEFSARHATARANKAVLRSFRRFDSSIGFFARADAAGDDVLTAADAEQSCGANWSKEEPETPAEVEIGDISDINGMEG